MGGSEKKIRDLFAPAEAEQNEKGDDSDLHIIIFDEIDLQPKTDFSQHLKKRIPSAKKAMVVMVRGLRKSFKEVVYYDFDRQMDMDLLGKIIVQVEKAGGAVRAVTLDMGNKKLLKEFKVNIITRVLSIPVFYLLGFPRSLLLLPPEQS